MRAETAILGHLTVVGITSSAEPELQEALADERAGAPGAAEELDRYDGLWWSHDGRHLAFAHVDERHLPTFTIAHLGAADPHHEEHRYPFAGGPNARVTLRIATIDGRGVVDVDLGAAKDDYVARVPADLGSGSSRQIQVGDGPTSVAFGAGERSRITGAPVSAPVAYVTVTSRRAGVARGSLVVSSARYCR